MRKRSSVAAPAALLSSYEPPSYQPQEACLPPHERRRCLCGWVSCCHRACATAAQHTRPHAERLHAHRVSRSASCSAACCLLAMHRASASTAARTGAEGALSPPHMLPRLGPLFVRRSAHQTANGSRRYGCEAWKAPRGTAMILDPCLRCGIRGESDHCFIRDRKVLATDCVTSGRRLRGREEEKGEPRRAQPRAREEV